MSRAVAQELLLTLPQALLYSYMVTASVRMRHPRLYAGCCLLLTAGLLLLCRAVPARLQPAVLALAFAQALLLPALFAAQERCGALLCALAYLGGAFAAAGLVQVWSALCRNIYPPAAGMPLCGLAYLLLLTLLLSAVRALLRRFTAPQKLSPLQAALLALPLGQLALLGLLLYREKTGAAAPGSLHVLLLAVLCTGAAELCYFSLLAQARSGELLHKQLEQAQDALDGQMRHYERLSGSLLQVNRIRHDLNNQLQTAYTLLERGDDASARALLEPICTALQEKAGPAYCANPVADAVLTDKAAVCAAQGIRLRVQAQLPWKTGVEGVHLCSALVNLLDNAIAGCRGCEQPWIELDAELRAGCLVLRCVNSTAEAAPLPVPAETEILPAHGLGLGILQQLADIYHGKLFIRREAGRCEASLVLSVPRAAQAAAASAQPETAAQGQPVRGNEL